MSPPITSIPVYMGTSNGNPFTTLSTTNGLRKLQVDSSNNLWITNFNYNQVYLIPASTGILSTFAGKGSQTGGFSGDGGPATSAEFNLVEDVAIDTSGAPLLSLAFIPFFLSLAFIPLHNISSYLNSNHSSIPIATFCIISGNVYIADGSNRKVASFLCVFVFDQST